MGPQKVLLLKVRMDLEVIAMKLYSTFPKTQYQEPRDQMIKSHKEDTFLSGVGI